MPRFACVLVAIAAFLALACAVTIDPNLPDGVYQINWARGLHPHVLVLTYFDTPADVNFTAPEFNGQIPLPGPKPYCYGSDRRLEKITIETNFTRAGDQEKAMNMLANWCETATWVQRSALVVAIVNDMLWYVCNWNNSYKSHTVHSQQRCSKLEIFAANGLLDYCGVGKRGELYIGKWAKTMGRSHRFGDICNGKELEYPLTDLDFDELGH